MRLRHRVPLSVAALALGLALISGSLRAQLTVYDPANHAENILQAARALQQINNQIQALQNQVLMLENMAKHLQRMDYSSVGSMQNALRQINGMMTRAEGIAFQVNQSETAFARYYPKEYAVSVTRDQLAQDARQRWLHSMDALRHTTMVQAQVVQNVESDTDELARLVNESQVAVGSLQAQQAGNQLIALSAKQQLQTQEMLAAQYRADALVQARDTAAQEQARVQFEQFIGQPQIYTPLR